DLIEFIQEEWHTSSEHSPQLAEVANGYAARPFIHKCFFKFQRQHATIFAVVVVDPFGGTTSLELDVLAYIDKQLIDLVVGQKAGELLPQPLPLFMVVCRSDINLRVLANGRLGRRVAAPVVV